MPERRERRTGRATDVPRAIAAVFAHPDDETFGIGGTVARYAAAGVTCHLYCATDGSAGRSSGIPVASREELGMLRRNELDTAARLLGFRGVRHGGHTDGELARADADALVGEIVAVLRATRPGVVLTFGPEGAPNAHADHRAISRAATAAFFLAGNPTAYPGQLGGDVAPWAPARLLYVTWKDDPGARVQGLPVDVVVDVAAQRQVKRNAFLAHVTQRDHLERFEQVALGAGEAFALAAGRPFPGPRADDLFAGL